MKFRVGGSAYTGRLPEGCKLCGRGVKLVVFITGLCIENCYYCPVSFKRWGRDVVYANEREVKKYEDLLVEAVDMEAEGAGITGGEPLLRVERVVEIVKLLKSNFTDKFHVHLYTSGRLATPQILRELEKCGVDEIRFHIIGDWGFEKVRDAVNFTSVDVGIEIPCIPGSFNLLKKIILKAEEIGVKFVNINELEASEKNVDALKTRGFSIDKRYPVVEGSLELGHKVLKWAESSGVETPIHFCTANFKDAVQTKKRMLRTALRIKKPYQKVSSEGLLEELIVDVSRNSLGRLLGTLSVKEPYYSVETFRGKTVLKLHPKFTSKIKRLKLKALRRLIQPTVEEIVVLEEDI